MDEIEFNKLFIAIGYSNHRLPTLSWELKEIPILWADTTYVVNGRAEYCINGVKYPVAKGDLLCTQKNWLRSAYTFPDDLIECYSVSGPVYNSFFQETPLPFPTLSHIGIHHDVISVYQQLTSAWLSREPGYEMKARGLYMTILQRFFQLIYFNDKENNYDRRIKKAIEYIIAHYHENITISSVSEKSGLNASYFGNLFKKETGKSFHQYLTDIRLNNAESMLVSGKYKVNEVAWACGFSDPFYFSKVYSKHRGTAPSKV